MYIYERIRKMNITQPIRSKDDLKKLRNYYIDKHPNKRNYLLIVMALNTALRISDVLNLRWSDVYDIHVMDFKTHIIIEEKKTGKKARVYINDTLKSALSIYLDECLSKRKFMAAVINRYIFTGQKSANRSISRVQAFRIITKAADESNIKQQVSCHSLRKTFGYQAWKQGVSPALLTNIYNHSSYKVTVRYLGIEQDDRDEAFRNIKL